jgi:hypothetical protein
VVIQYRRSILVYKRGHEPQVAQPASPK